MATIDETRAFAALRKMDFYSVIHRDDIWSDGAFDVPEVHAELRAEYTEQLNDFCEYPNARAPGWLIVGPAGSGKSHLLGHFRREAARLGAAFVIVDMTDVRNFWDNLLHGMMGSLQERYHDNLFQHQWLLQRAIGRFRFTKPLEEVLLQLSRRRSQNLRADIQKVLAAFARLGQPLPTRYQDVLRSLVCLNSEDPGIFNRGMTWLYGLELSAEEQAELGFASPQAPAFEIAGALSWVMSLAGPTVLAFDQLDPIVNQAHRRAEVSDEQQANLATSIIREIGDGFAGVIQTFPKTWVVIACLEQSYKVLRQHTLRSTMDRLEVMPALRTVPEARIARQMIEQRVALGLQQTGFEAPYPSWPFHAEAFETAANLTPREILRRCHEHKNECLRSKQLKELRSFGADQGIVREDPVPTQVESSLQTTFEQYHAAAAATELLQDEERLAALLQVGLECFITEAQLPPHVSATVDVNFVGGTRTKPLAARLRIIFHQEGEREVHFSTRAVQTTVASSYLARMKAAVTASGIDPQINFRRLVIIRTTAEMTSPAAGKLTDEFRRAGGIFHAISEDELRSLAALAKLREENDPDFEAWLRHRRAASSLAVLRTIAPHPLLLRDDADSPAPQKQVPAPSLGETDPPVATVIPERNTAQPNPPKPPQPAPPVSPTGKVSLSGRLPLGRRLVGEQLGDHYSIPLEELAKHMVVLAGAGSGKTVLLRRVIEEALLRGIPSIVVDCGQDLSTLGQRWAEVPKSWTPEDHALAEEYHNRANVVIWTPGRETGNPLSLQVLPDLAAVANDPDELNEAVEMAAETLGSIAIRGRSEASGIKAGLIRAALRFHAMQGGLPELPSFIAFLRDLPADVGSDYSNRGKHATAMADLLTAEKDKNPLLRIEGTPLDPAILFGDDRPETQGRRISVLSLIGLQGLDSQQAFVNQLAMTLFGWIKKNPQPPGRSLRGLLVIDEAKDFAPNQRTSRSGASLLRLVAQARKYRLGVIFATQNPTDLDGKIISNCSTHGYGKVSGPAAIQRIRDQITQRNGNGGDISSLTRGTFYAYNADSGYGAPVKIRTPLCLSHHRPSPPSPEEILAWAQQSRNQL